MSVRCGDLGNESIAVSWHGFDVLSRMEEFPQLRNAIVQIVVFDNGVRPYRLHERVFAHELAGILHQHAKSVEQFASEADFLVITKKPSLVHIEEINAKEIFGHCQATTRVRGHRKAAGPHIADILPAGAGARYFRSNPEKFR